MVAVALALLVLISLARPVAAAARRIRFRPGHTSGRVHGRLTGIHDRADFVLRARAGQRMRVQITGRGPTRGVVRFPSGKEDGGPGGVVFDDRLTETGNYRIRVTESSMAQQWHGPFVLEVRIR